MDRCDVVLFDLFISFCLSGVWIILKTPLILLEHSLLISKGFCCTFGILPYVYFSFGFCYYQIPLWALQNTTFSREACWEWLISVKTEVFNLNYLALSECKPKDYFRASEVFRRHFHGLGRQPIRKWAECTKEI